MDRDSIERVPGLAHLASTATVYTVTKSVRFCYGHRLLEYAGKCRHLHGHNAHAEITFESETLDERGMVYDFNEIKDCVKSWLDAEVDHTLLLHRDDPVIGPLRDAGERMLVVDWNPTAENIARMIFDYVAARGYPVTEVALWETDTACARYRR